MPKPETTQCRCGMFMCPICRPAPETTEAKNIFGETIKLSVRQCEKCSVINEEVYDVNYDAPYPIREKWLCDNCAEGEYMKQHDLRRP